MTPVAALAALDAAGVRVRLQADGTVRLDASNPPTSEVLALARAHRDGIAALLRNAATPPDSPMPPMHPMVFPSLPLAAMELPGVPPVWCEGVARLAAMPAPSFIAPARWAAFAAASARLLQQHGAELCAAGWDALDLFGLHGRAPTEHPAGWGLAWLLGHSGKVLDVTPEGIGMRRQPDGARQTFCRGQAAAQSGVVPAWKLEAAPSSGDGR